MHKYRRARREKKSVKKKKIIIFFFIINTISIILLSLALSAQTYSSFESNENSYYQLSFYKHKVTEIEFITREEINKEIKNLDSAKIINFYSQYTDNQLISETIIKESLANNVPINLVFSLVWKESRFNPTAYNKNFNGSIDRGLFQLNNSYRRLWTKEEFYNIIKNTEEGVKYLSYCINNTLSIPQALGAYNAGLSKAIKNKLSKVTNNYIEDILQYEDALNEDFNIEFLKWIPG